MGKLTALVLSFLLFFDFFGCPALRVKFAECAGLEMMQAIMVNPRYDENGDLLTCQFELHWDGREYEEYGFADYESIGNLFGLTLRDKGSCDRVFLVAGERPEDWLIWNYGEPMSAFILCKEKSVTDIPDGFVPFGSE